MVVEAKNGIFSYIKGMTDVRDIHAKINDRCEEVVVYCHTNRKDYKTIINRA